MVNTFLSKSKKFNKFVLLEEIYHSAQYFQSIGHCVPSLFRTYRNYSTDIELNAKVMSLKTLDEVDGFYVEGFLKRNYDSNSNSAATGANFSSHYNSMLLEVVQEGTKRDESRMYFICQGFTQAELGAGYTEGRALTNPTRKKPIKNTKNYQMTIPIFMPATDYLWGWHDNALKQK